MDHIHVLLIVLIIVSLRHLKMQKDLSASIQDMVYFHQEDVPSKE